MTDDAPFALLLTWTTYGTWLPGDERGYVASSPHATGGSTPRQNIPGSPYAAGDGFVRWRAGALQTGDSVWLSRQQAVWAAHSFVGTARGRSWRILRGAIMSNHVHLVVMDCPGTHSSCRERQSTLPDV